MFNQINCHGSSLADEHFFFWGEGLQLAVQYMSLCLCVYMLYGNISLIFHFKNIHYLLSFYLSSGTTRVDKNAKCYRPISGTTECSLYALPLPVFSRVLSVS